MSETECRPSYVVFNWRIASDFEAQRAMPAAQPVARPAPVPGPRRIAAALRRVLALAWAIPSRVLGAACAVIDVIVLALVRLPQSLLFWSMIMTAVYAVAAARVVSTVGQFLS